MVQESEEGLEGRIEYSTDLYEAASIDRMVRHWQILLKAILLDPHQRVSELPMLTETERRQLLVEWNDTKQAFPRDRFMSELFEEQAERTPEAVAVIFEEQRVTYGEINRRANHLAHYLGGRGVGPEMRVGICLERSVELVVGLLGILKAGAAYVPLDPEHPRERLQYLLEDAGVSVLLTQVSVRDRLPEYSGDTICLDRDWETIARQSGLNRPHRAQPGNLAYVIYTSGSTGLPKGVTVSHAALASYIEMAGKKFELVPGDRSLQFASIAFDVAAEEIYASLSCGSTLVLSRDRKLASVDAFLSMCSELKITVLSIPTPLWQQIASETCLRRVRVPSCVRLVIIGGDRALGSYVRQWREQCDQGVRLLNFYGPTEATISATSFEVTSSTNTSSMAELPIGKALPGARIYILDRHRQPVPVGVAAELHIGGVGLARGYLNRPDLTAEKFIPNPFSHEPGERLYRTGDLARYCTDGTIEFLGRMDAQVKIRGYRIEPGEIEAALLQHPGVREVVVLAREDVPGDKRLVAYVVPQPAQAPSSAEFRSHLQLRLPDYMLPSAFVCLPALPLTPSGKVDRSTLAATEVERTERTPFSSPRDPIELQLMLLWEQLLGLSSVGIRDNFFDLGGHSLLAIRLMAQIRERFGQELPLATLFQAPTLEGFAKLLRHGWAAEQKSPIVQIRPGVSGSRPLFVVHPASGNVLCYVELARALTPDSPCTGWSQRTTESPEDQRKRASRNSRQHTLRPSLSTSLLAPTC